MTRELQTLLIFISITWLSAGWCNRAFGNEIELRVSVPPFPPFAFFDDNKQCEGSVVRLLNKISDESNIKFTLINYPYGRILHALGSGELDVALIFKNASVSKSVDYIGPVSKSKVVVIGKKNMPIAGYSDLKKFNSIAAIRNAHYEPQFDSDPSINKMQVNNYSQAIRMFKFDRVDAVVGSLVGLEYAIYKQKLDLNEFSNVYPLGEQEWWLHMSKKSKHRHLKPLFDEVVKKMYADDLLYQVYKDQIESCLPN